MFEELNLEPPRPELENMERNINGIKPDRDGSLYFDDLLSTKLLEFYAWHLQGHAGETATTGVKKSTLE